MGLTGSDARGWLIGAATLAVVLLACGCHSQRHTVLTVSVAASLTDTIEEIEKRYMGEHAGVELRNNSGSSGVLAQEIEQGAPVDIFLSAAERPMDELQSKGLIVAGTRRNLLRNSLVLIAPRGTPLRDFQGLADPSMRLMALGDPATVPAGQYGKQTLMALHLYEVVERRLVLAKDVRQVLAYVEMGDVDAGIVYGTDAQHSDKVRVVATAPESTHDPIVYPVAVIRASRNEDVARGFTEYLSGPEAKGIFAAHGFTMAAQ
jgi:molybdate transport system substrate-binding protein